MTVEFDVYRQYFACLMQADSVKEQMDEAFFKKSALGRRLRRALQKVISKSEDPVAYKEWEDELKAMTDESKSLEIEYEKHNTTHKAWLEARQSAFENAKIHYEAWKLTRVLAEAISLQ